MSKSNNYSSLDFWSAEVVEDKNAPAGKFEGYPTLRMDDALNGHPVVIVSGSGRLRKAYLYKSRASNKEEYIVEFCDTGCTSRFLSCQLSAICRMYEPIFFHRWHLLPERVVAIRKSSHYKWKALNAMGKAFASYNELTLKDGFFPECEVGTVISRT